MQYREWHFTPFYTQIDFRLWMNILLFVQIRVCHTIRGSVGLISEWTQNDTEARQIDMKISVNTDNYHYTKHSFTTISTLIYVIVDHGILYS